MKNVTYINAGAGSGKTYTLIEKLTELIHDKKVAPEQVILTTFTTKAANEFKEKAKNKLYELGLFDEAIRLDQALIGTIHSVCQKMIGKYWFSIGLAPDMGVMAEEDTEFYITQTLADLPTDEELKYLHNFAYTFSIPKKEGIYSKGIDYDFWQWPLKAIIDFSTNYEITDFETSEKQSILFIKQFLDETINIQFSKEEIEAFLNEHEAFLRERPENDKNNERIEKLIYARQHSSNLAINDLKSLGEIVNSLKDRGPLADAFVQKINELWHSPLVFKKQEEYIKLMFKLANRWSENFIRYKQEKNLIDFNDMEKYMRKLMDVKEIAEDIKLTYKYLFVDEFQDSSPIQIKIFDKLSDMMEHSYWVGDYKQAIFGFRGSAVSLTKSVVDRIREGKNGCDTTTLDTSYRSLPDIVNIDNQIFNKTFAGALSKKNIELKTHRKNDNKETSLRYFITEQGITIAHHVSKLIAQGIAPKDIAILARKNEDLFNISNDLAEMGIPSSRDELSIMLFRTTLLVVSLLKIIEDDKDKLARATVAIIEEEDFNRRALIEKSIEYLNTEHETCEYLTDIELISKVIGIRKRLKQQSIASLVESLIIELGLYDISKKIDYPTIGASCLNVLIATARTYEDHCVQMNLPATTYGFISYLDKMHPSGTGDPDGVQLHTYHKSKGLEWKYVILTSLDRNITDEDFIIKKEIYGVHFAYTEEPNHNTPYPEVYIRLIPWVYANSKKTPDDIKSIIIEQNLSDIYSKAYKKLIEEENRLLYVGMTRPSDVLLLNVVKPKKGKKTPFKWFSDSGYVEIEESIPQDLSKWDIFNCGFEFSNFTITNEELEKIEFYNNPDESLFQIPNIIQTEEAEKLPCHISPSGMTGICKIGEFIDFKKRIPLGKNIVDMAIVGDCIHQIFASIDNKIDIKSTINSYKLKEILTDDNSIIEAWVTLTNYLKTKYGEAKRIYHERPFRHETNGQIITGSIDLVWQTKEGDDILIDFKTCPMGVNVVTDENSEHYAGKYGGQLNAYTNALEEAKEKVIARLIYYPISGIIVEVSRKSI